MSHSHRCRVPWIPSWCCRLWFLWFLWFLWDPWGLCIRCRAERSMAEPRHGHRRNKRGGSAGSGSGHGAWVGKGKWEVMWWDTGRGERGRRAARNVVGRGVQSWVCHLGAAALTALREASDCGV